MTKEEFLYQFDVLYNNITSNQAPGLNGYEKSVFLTKAQYEVLKNYFNPKSNKLTEGYSDSPKRHVDFSKLVKESTNSSNFPSDVMFILEETCKENGKQMLVVPIDYKEYQRMLTRPYPYPLKRQVWRLTGATTENTTSNTFVFHPGGTEITDYKLRYIKTPNPIIVGDAADFLIEGSTYATIDNHTVGEDLSIEIPVELHQEVLQRAVELAKIAWLGDINSTLAAGQRDE